ncbi:MAG: outer membrane protein assembly factor BamA, partial [SAR324 cluster bacterium]|nr:outer membrane protein assembly factor BamA [SAR324 cluster bacterium]
SVDVETDDTGQLTLIFKLVEKPRIALIEIKGNRTISTDSLKEQLKVFQNNMVDRERIKADVNLILEEYRKKGYMQTQVDYQIEKINHDSVTLTYRVTESPKVFLTDIDITGTKVYPPLDIERIMISAEVDCFSWMNESGVFQESKVNQDLQVIMQHYLSNGYIKVSIDKPKAVLFKNRDYSRVKIGINITEGEQYFTGAIDIISDDSNELLLDKAEILSEMVMQTGNVFNPYGQNEDRFKISQLYHGQGYAFSEVRVSNKINEDTKTVDLTFHVTRGEKAYIGRVEIEGNYETMDHVVRRELEIYDNELYDGVKLTESQSKITRLGFFEQGLGVRLIKSQGAEENTLDYKIMLQEAQTGTFNASLSYSGYSGFAVLFSVSKKNFLGSGRTVTVSTEQQAEGESRYDFSLISPYWFGTQFMNSFRIFSIFENQIYYDTRTTGLSFGLSYPVWKYLTANSTYSWRNEDYTNVNDIGKESLDGVLDNAYRSVRLGTTYSTVDHPMFPSKGHETSFSVEEFGGAFGGSIKYRAYNLSTKYFKTLNESGTLIFGAKFNWARLQKTSSSREILLAKRFLLGGITTVRGFEYDAIEGPSSTAELGENPADFIRRKYPYQGDVSDCQSDPVCAALPASKDTSREYFEQHRGGITRRVLNLQLYYPLTREGTRIRGLVFFDAGNVWAEDRMYEITNQEKNDWYYRTSAGVGVNLITPMGVLRFEYGMKLDRKPEEPPSKFDFHISGLF